MVTDELVDELVDGLVGWFLEMDCKDDMLLLSVSKDCVAFNSDSICFIVVTVDRISV